MESLLDRLRRPHILIAAGVFVLTLGVYVTTLGPTMEFWDCGEFITTSHIVGIPHQPGTPMYVLMGRVFDVIFGDPQIDQPAFRTAWALNFMSAFFSALAVTFVFLLIRELARRADPDVKWLPEIGGVVGALFLAFSETYWNNAVEAEVYGLSAFMMAVLSWLAVRWYDHREQPASDHLLLLMIYLLGLGVGFHLGSVLVYPGVFLLVLLSTRRNLPVFDLVLMSMGLAIFLASTSKPREGPLAESWDTLIILALIVYAVVVALRSLQGRRFALVGSALFFVGLTVHVMMMIRAGADPEPLINQTDPDNFAALMSVIRREQYPPLDPFQRQAPLSWQYGYYYGFLFKQFYFLGPGHGLLTVVTTVLGPIFLALVGLFHAVRRLFPLVLVPLAGYLFNGEILTLYLNFTDHEVRERDYFYFAAFLFVAVFIGLGASALMRYAQGGEGQSAGDVEKDGGDWRTVARKAPKWSVWLVAGVLLVAAVLPLAPGSVKYWEHDRSDNHLAYEYAWNILAGLDENAIIFTNGDNDTFPIWYLQMVEKFREDVTVVNLSLVNLTWYIKQLRYHHGLEFSRTDEEIDRLRHRMFEDPETGQRELVMIKDYVVHDIIATNLQQTGRPIFFAVTIPQENMKRYFANLSMEGMHYRLVTESSPDNLPTTNADRVMENMLGVYKLDSVQGGDSAERRRLYAEMAGRVSDNGTIVLGQWGKSLSAEDVAELGALLGERRRDTFRSINARHLLGNYPTAFNRAGYDYIQQSEAVAETDTVSYRQLLAKAAAAFEASLAMEPYNEHAMDFYPLLLVQLYRDKDARDFLASLHGKVDQELEERVVYRTFQGLIQGGLSPIALGWVREWRQADPQRGLYYMLEFRLYEAMGELEAARAIAEEWAGIDGVRNPEMDRALADMEQRAGARERESTPGTGGGQDGR